MVIVCQKTVEKIQFNREVKQTKNSSGGNFWSDNVSFTFSNNIRYFNIWWHSFLSNLILFLQNWEVIGSQQILIVFEFPHGWQTILIHSWLHLVSPLTTWNVAASDWLFVFKVYYVYFKQLFIFWPVHFHLWIMNEWFCEIKET